MYFSSLLLLSLSLSRASETPIMITLLHLLVSHISLRLFSIVFILLFLCSLAESLYHSPSISLIFLKFKSTNLSLSGNFFFNFSYFTFQLQNFIFKAFVYGNVLYGHMENFSLNHVLYGTKKRALTF